EAVGFVAAVRDDVASEYAARRLHGIEGLARFYSQAGVLLLSQQLEIAAAMLAVFLSAGIAFLAALAQLLGCAPANLLHALLDDLVGLTHLFDPAHVAIPRIAIAGAHRHRERQLIVDRVRSELAEIVIDAGAPQARPGNPVVYGQLLLEDADPFGALEEDRIFRDNRFVFVDSVRKLLRKLLEFGKPTGWRFAHHTTDTYVVEHHALPGNRFKQIEKLLALPKWIEGKTEHGSQVDQVRTQPEQVRGDSVHLRDHHAHVFRT